MPAFANTSTLAATLAIVRRSKGNMQSLIIFASLAVIFLAGFAVTMILSIVKRQRVFLLISLTCLVLCCSAGGYAMYLTLSKTSNKLQSVLKPRDGIAIYRALFGSSELNCVEILDRQDQIVPRLDVGIFLHFRTCESEIKRIVKKAELTARGVLSNEQTSIGQSEPSWFQPILLGDSVFVWKYSRETGNNWRALYVDKNMSEAYYSDIAD